jgi:thiol-disulfide isomerase/thioredoxin
MGTVSLLPRRPARSIVAMLTPQKVGGPAASLAPLKYVQGDPFEIGRGKVTVVEFWATWCPPCKVAIPHLNKLYVNKYKAKGVQLVGVTKEDEGTVKPFIAERKGQFTYPVAIDGTGATATLLPALHATAQSRLPQLGLETHRRNANRRNA